MSQDQASSATSRYRRSTQAILLFGVPFFLVMALASAYWAVIDDRGLAMQAILAVLALFFALGSWFGWRLFPFLRATVTADETGLSVSRNGRCDHYAWTQLSHHVDRPALQVLDVYSHDGNRVLSVDYWVTDFAVLKSVVRSNLATRR